MATTIYGLSSIGFTPKRQAVILAELQDAIRSAFGTNVNLDSRSVFGQLIAIFAEREALLWELGEAIYASQYPSGAEGIGVDNILALSNMRRLGASASRTNSTPVVDSTGRTLHGLVLFGTPGTTVPKGSIIRTTTTPQLSFTLDADVIIQPSVNAIQALVYSTAPDSGSYNLNLTSYRTGATLFANVPFDASPHTSVASFTGSIGGGSYYLLIENQVFGPFNTTSSGTIEGVLVASAYPEAIVIQASDSPSNPLMFWFGADSWQPRVRFDGTKIAWSASTFSSGTYVLTIGGVSTAPLSTLNASTVQAAIRAASPTTFGDVYVSLDNTGANLFINWNDAPHGAVSVPAGSNTTGLTATVSSTNTSGLTFTVSDSIQTRINTLRDRDASRPFTDVVVTDAFQVQFGVNTPVPGEPSSAGRSIAAMTVSANALLAGSSLVTVDVVPYAEGAPSEGIGSATCTVTGPSVAPAGTLTVIGSPASGWSSVNNELDVIAGRNVETDLEALTRRQALLPASSSGPLQSIVANLLSVTGVTSAQAFQNVYDSALQVITFSTVPATPGTQYQLQFPSTGDITGPIAYNATASDVQAAINAIPAFAQVVVSGSAQYGFTLDFNGAMGGQEQPLTWVINNTTGPITTVAYGRSAKSVEAIVLGGSSSDIAAAIHAKLTAGISAYGAPVQSTTASMTSGSATIAVTDATGIVAGLAATGLGIPPDTTVATVSGTTVTLSNTVSVTSASAPVTFTNTFVVTDAYGNGTPVSFTRPTATPVYVTVTLTTDIYRSPGNPSSGLNPFSQFSPSSLAQIQADIMTIGNALGPGAMIIGKGTHGLMGAFNDVLGIVNYLLHFDLVPSPSGNNPIQLQPNQAPVFLAGNVAVSYT